ncbi:hypothetical protein KKC45_01110 [Patescibacteria group bacterium]|nr:hypothetical protein [Patescibacteria group bacterium]
MNFNFKKNKDGGFVIITVALFSLLISISLVSIISSPVISEIKTNRDLSKSKHSFFTAESNSEDVIYRIKNGMEVSSQEEIELNGGTGVAVVSDLSEGVKEITSVGDNYNRIRKIKNNIRVSTGVSFNYGLFVGQGGVSFDSNTRINGSIYSNGNIIGGSNSVIAGDVYVATQIATTTDTEWTVYNEDFEFGLNIYGQNRIDVVQSFKFNSDDVYLAKAGLYLKKVGSPSNISVKVAEDKNGIPDKNDIVTTGTISSGSVGTSYSFVDVSFNENEEVDSDETYWLILDLVQDDENYYVWGFDNTDGYAEGTASFSSNWLTGGYVNIGGDLDFKIWVGDLNRAGLLKSVVVDDGLGGFFSAYAHTIMDSDVSGDVFASSFTDGSVGGDIVANNLSDCSVSGDASYNFSTNCLIGGTETTPTTIPVDPPFLAYPISEANIESWKDLAIEGGVISTGDYEPEDGQVIGPGVIEGDLIVAYSTAISLDGTVYVKGNIIIASNSEINLTSDSRVLLADGWVNIGLSSSVNGSLSDENHLMILSLARCDDIWGKIDCNVDEASISAGNNVVADILAAPYGAIRMDNNITVVTLVGSQLILKNNIVLNYEQGLTNINFSSGPSGTWAIDSWREIE